MPAAERRATRTLGRYTLCDEIGGGGMATVHLGRLAGPVGFGRTVAIKRMHRDYVRDPEFVAMFVDEARLAARVHHPNVVQTLDVIAEGSELFLVMEYIQGAALARLLRAGAVPSPIALAVGCGLLHGLHAAHEATDEHGEPLDIVHRDVSPHNVVVGTDGVARVLDFGIAKATGRQQATRDGQIKGKFAYMAPEQITNVHVTRQSDVFAASIVIWEMLTGARLFKAETEQGTLAHVMAGPIPAPSTIMPGLPAELDVVLARGLERDVSKRYRTAREMARDLERLPRASQSEVGEWVSAVAGEELTERAERVASIESGNVRGEQHSGLRPSVPTAVESRESTQLSTSAPSARARTQTRKMLVPIVLASALSMAVGGTLVWLRRPSSVVVTATQPSAPTEHASSSPVEVPLPVVIDLDPTAQADPPVNTVARTRPRPTASASASATPAPDCNPPSYVGQDGRTHYKLECFKGRAP